MLPGPTGSASSSAEVSSHTYEEEKGRRQTRRDGASRPQARQEVIINYDLLFFFIMIECRIKKLFFRR